MHNLSQAECLFKRIRAPRNPFTLKLIAYELQIREKPAAAFDFAR